MPRRFRSGPKIVAPLLNMLQIFLLMRRKIKKQDINLIHARSYMPAAIAMVVSKITRVPFIFDMRALWPEELITANRIRRGSWVHRAIVAAERACLRNAAGVVSLTNAAALHLRTVYRDELDGQRLAIIPTCADLTRFTPAPTPPGDSRVHGCIGTVTSGWFRTDWLVRWFALVSQEDASATFEIVTRDDTALVRRTVDPDGKLGKRLFVRSCFPEDMPIALQGHDVSVMFYAGGEISELGRSPTRMAEILGCGLPVVANEGVGDVAEIIRDHNVGVLVRSSSPEDMRAAWTELETLMSDPDLAARCRKAAEDVFSLEAGTESIGLYTAQ